MKPQHTLFLLPLALSSTKAFMPDDLSHLHVYDARAVQASLDKRAPPSTAMKLVTNMQGANFFSYWDFFSYPDPTHGQVNYVNQATAMQKKNPLAFVKNGNAILKVDNTTWLNSGANRNSVRITSKQPFVKGQLLVVDVDHMPTGCTTWPAFWTVGANWPNGGEIDIIEGVNNQAQNQYTLHTSTGCTVKQPMTGTGKVLLTNCDANVNGNTGCGIQDPSKFSYGAGLNARGGGAYATLWNDDGIYVWFFPTNKIPWDLRRARPVPANWGKPVAFWSAATCDTDKFFGNQTIVINTTLNGDWAGAVYNQMGCPGSASAYVANPTHYNDAYWEIASVRIYQ